MRTAILKIDPGIVDPKKIGKIVKVLRRDGLIVYPTETFYGIGASAFSGAALRRIYLLKRREGERLLPVVVSDLDMAKRIVGETPGLFNLLAHDFWPGPLTLVVKASPTLPQELVGPERTIGLRLPSPSWLRELVRQLACPLTATSANISGEKENSDPAEVVELFQGRVDLIVDGGKTPGSLPSTVVDLTRERPIILREGVIPSSALKKYLGNQP